jgi:voltage-gated potassium channel
MMPGALRRNFHQLWRRAPWATLAGFVAAFYLAGYVLMLCFEPVTNPIRSFPTYTYFFIVTVTTVGYGDVVPVTTAGRFAAGAIAIGSIGAVAVALGRVFSAIGEYVRRREKGLIEFDMKGHIVIFGNRGGETAALIRLLIADRQSSGTQIVLCSFSTERNPFPDFIDFVRGELTSSDVMTRACVKDAGKVIIHAGTDYESISVALAVKEINPTAPIVVRANDPSKEVDIERVDRGRVVCISSVEVPMMVREIHNPGITQVIERLLSPDGQDLRSIQEPVGSQPLRFGVVANKFRERHAAILIGMRPGGNGVNSGAILNPAFNAMVEGGMFLDYISRDAIEVNWPEMTA